MICPHQDDDKLIEHDFVAEPFCFFVLILQIQSPAALTRFLQSVVYQDLEFFPDNHAFAQQCIGQTDKVVNREHGVV